MAAGADPNALNKRRSSVATLAVEYGNPDLVALLLGHGAAIDSMDFLGDPLLFSAAYEGRAAIVRLLLDRGAKMEGTGYHGTILMHAVHGKNTEIIKIFTDCGADVNAADKWGFTPLMTAAREGDTGVAKALLALGARADARNYEKTTACDIAVAYNRAEIAEILCGR